MNVRCLGSAKSRTASLARHAGFLSRRGSSKCRVKWTHRNGLLHYKRYKVGPQHAAGMQHHVGSVQLSGGVSALLLQHTVVQFQ